MQVAFFNFERFPLAPEQELQHGNRQHGAQEGHGDTVGTAAVGDLDQGWLQTVKYCGGSGKKEPPIARIFHSGIL